MNIYYLILSFFILINCNFLNSCETKQSSESKVKYEKGCSSLMNSIYGNNIAKVKDILLNNKCLANCEENTTAPGLGNESTRPLTFAARLGRTEIVKLLLEAGAEIDFIDNGKTALYFAIDNFKPKVVKVLVKNKANKQIKFDEFDGALAYTIHQYNFAKQFPGLLDNAKLLEIIKILT